MSEFVCEVYMCVCMCVCTEALYQMLAEWSTGGSIELWPETGRQYLDLSRPPPFLSLIFITSTDWSSNKKEPDAVAHTLKHILHTPTNSLSNLSDFGGTLGELSQDLTIHPYIQK